MTFNCKFTSTNSFYSAFDLDSYYLRMLNEFFLIYFLSIRWIKIESNLFIHILFIKLPSNTSVTNYNHSISNHKSLITFDLTGINNTDLIIYKRSVG